MSMLQPTLGTPPSLLPVPAVILLLQTYYYSVEPTWWVSTLAW